MKQLTLKVDGMMCGHCEAHVNDAVRKAANVQSVTSSHASGTTVVVLDDSVSADAIVEAIQNEGYKVLGFEEQPYKKPGLFSKLFKK